ncbi:uncharacterized protein A1O9_11330 [Exophiala aquamarina CBS 119918]|uniref:Uncharacterized protein n=1 Tax=Exophiala aquamarina CBS 119918 TaxID=1182545 RepID=A0A072NZN5_9EURO|nr:uncharacterized protein A1O9_11330 [Exophiala aquamarina CBS 119918]KEF52488.1 hypothetical protein A1O9_11330 [Exophiala aquamarina CBS 119918]
MDEFAQSRGDDDLFDDEIVPFDTPPSPEKVAAQLEHISLQSSSSDAPGEVDAATSRAPTARHDSSEALRARPRGRGSNAISRADPGKRVGLSESKWAAHPAASSKPKSSVKETASTSTLETQPAHVETPATSHQPEDSTADSTPTMNTSISSVNPNPRPPAVRGDRTATGGVRKPKLTEEELSAKLAEAKERSQNRAAAHARAQADAANFEERERIAEQKRAKDRVERKVMDNEREKNRQRKIAVMGGREWDAGKNEEDFRANGSGRGGRRGYQPGLTPQQYYAQDEDDLKQYEWNEDRGRGRGTRGRGGRGGRGRGRGGRGGFGNDDRNSPHSQQQPAWSADADFPALPGSEGTQKKQTGNETTSARPGPARWASGDLATSGNGAGGGSWAEQVEASEL